MHYVIHLIPYIDRSKCDSVCFILCFCGFFEDAGNPKDAKISTKLLSGPVFPQQINLPLI